MKRRNDMMGMRFIGTVAMFVLLMATLSAQEKSSEKKVLEALDPSSIDLSEPTVFMVPYSHLDDIWRWSYTQTVRDFLRHTLDDNFEAFEKYPNYVFNWSGASRYQMMKEYYPKKYEELKEWIAAGRWYPSGSSWVENDVNVPSSEAVVRQMLMGTEYFKNEFGKESREFMLPDCFGFSYALPSILSHCGIRGFSTQKLTWESANGIPFNVGRWIGPDGEWVIASLNAGNYAAEHTHLYNSHAPTLERLEKNKEVSGLPIDYYYVGGGDKNNADRGGAPMIANIELLEACADAEGPVHVISGKADLMFQSISDEQAMQFPTWNKDLLLVKHSTGVLSSQAYTKKLNRKAELLADASERAAVTAYLLNGSRYPKVALNYAWGLALRNQFHDNLPGTSIPKAHDEGWNDGIIALNVFSGVYRDAIGALARDLHTEVEGVPLVIYNPLSIHREDLVEAFIPEELKGATQLAVFDAKGKEVLSQLTTGFDGKRRLLFRAELPPVGAAVYALRAVAPKLGDDELSVREDYLENDRYQVSIDANGDIASIFDKKIRKELLEEAIQHEFLEDFPGTKPAWRIYYRDIVKPARSVLSSPVSVEVVEKGPLRVAVEIERETLGTRVIQRVMLSSGDDGSRVETANQVDWKTRGALMKAAFHLTASAPEATYNLDLGNIMRGNRTETQYEVPHHAWFDLTNEAGDYGVSVLTGAKYGSDKVDDNTMRLTLIHGPNTKDSQQEVLDDGTMSEMRWQDWGRHEFSYALTGHAKDWREGRTHWEAMRFEHRLAAFAVPKHKAGESELSLFTVSNEQVNLQAVKMAEDGSGIIIRLQELNGKACENVKVSSLVPILAAEEMDGAERPLGIKFHPRKGVLSLGFSSYELKTIKLSMKGAELMTAATKPLALDYDTDVFSYNDSREDGYDEEYFEERRPRKEGYRGSLDGKGGTYPAEMIGAHVEMGNVDFVVGPKGLTEYNALACEGQDIELPEGTEVLHILAAADRETDVSFLLGDTQVPMTIGAWSGYLGLWDSREFEGYVAELSYSMRNELRTIHPAFIRDHRVAWAASHHHRPAKDAIYQYSYLFAYRLEIPEGVERITLPQSRFVRIVAMSVGDEGHAEALQSPFEDLHRDDDFRKNFVEKLKP